MVQPWCWLPLQLGAAVSLHSGWNHVLVRLRSSIYAKREQRDQVKAQDHAQDGESEQDVGVQQLWTIPKRMHQQCGLRLLYSLTRFPSRHLHAGMWADDGQRSAMQ